MYMFKSLPHFGGKFCTFTLLLLLLVTTFSYFTDYLLIQGNAYLCTIFKTNKKLTNTDRLNVSGVFS